MSVSISSRDSLYTGRDPGGGTRDIMGGARDAGGGARDAVGGVSREGEGGMPVHHVPNPPERLRPAGMRKGHQRQYSDPSSLVEQELGAS